MLKLATMTVFIALQIGCHLDSSGINHGSSSQPHSSGQKYSIDARVLDAIKTSIGDFSPMRGGHLFGVANDGEVEIRYFLHDYASPNLGGSYKPGDNINQNIGIVMHYPLSDKTTPLKNYLGHVHSAPGQMSYPISSHEDSANATLKASPAMHSYIMGIVTIGAATMSSVDSHEIKLSDNAKISFFEKKRGGNFEKIIVEKKPDSPLLSYQRMHSYVNAIAHIADAIKHLDLKAHGLEKGLNYYYKEDILHVTIQSSNKSILIKISPTYPATGPTLICYNINPAHGIIDEELDRDGASGNWAVSKPHEIFQQFLNQFITTKCPL